MPNRIDTTLAEILLAVKARLVEQSIFNDNTCFLGLQPELNHFPPKCDHYGIITPGEQNPINNEPQGILLEGSFTVTLWTLIGVDVAERNDLQLTDATHGIYPKALSIANALNLYDLVDASEILARPIKLIDKGEPEQSGQWASTEISFNILWGCSDIERPEPTEDWPLERQDTDMAAILAAIKAKIVADEVFNTSTVFLKMNPDKTKFPPNITHFAVIAPGVQRLINPECLFMRGTVRLTLWTFLGIDQAERNSLGLTDPDHGIYPKGSELLSTLNLYDLESDGKWILAQPMQLKGFGKPLMEGLWAKMVSTFEINYGLGAADPTAGRATNDGFSLGFG